MKKRSTNIIIISGPSGSGKDSVIKKLYENKMPIERIVTTTTRSPREGEKNGIDYYFVSEKEMLEKIEKNLMIEWAKADNGNYYGATKEELNRVKSLKDKIGIWKIEYKGVISAKKIIPDILTILIEPPDIETLPKRARSRGDKDEKQTKERLEYSKEFLSHKKIYDYSIINEDNKLSETTNKVIQILKKEGYI